MMDITDLMSRIRLGEDSTLELKQVLMSGDTVSSPRRNDFADELAGMANSRGGTIVLGIDDSSHDALGIPVERLDSIEGWVREICNDSIEPPLDAVIRKFELPDVTGKLVALLRIDIDRSLFVHRSPGGYFNRIGSSRRRMSPDLLARLFRERSQSLVIRFDESVVPHTAVQDLDYQLARKFLREDADLDERALRKLRVIADDESSAAGISVAGVLLCTRDPGRWLPHAQIQAVSYAGERIDVNYQNDAREIGGPLDEQVSEAMHFVRRNMRVTATKATARKDSPQFSERAVFEALVNAVAHRDYSIAGSQIRLHLFKNRMELYVPGNLANTLTPDSMDLRQYSRNQLIVSLLARCPVSERGEIGRSHLMDRRGDGVPIIFEESVRVSGRKPEYTLIDDSELLLVIWGGGDE